jgi:hypothetical protein
MRASRLARATILPSTSASIAMTWSGPSTRSSTEANGWWDLGEINGRVFVNNVSVGLYGEAVQHGTYRNAKIRTLLETVPDVLGPKARTDLRWRGPDGGEHAGSVAIVVSNNPYRLEAPVGAGGRPRLDQGLLGVAMLGEPDADGELRAWATPSFEIEAQAPVPAGVDGEAVVFDPPLRFRVRRGALRCRIARHHPGASPAALAPERARTALRLLVASAAGRDPSGIVLGGNPYRRTPWMEAQPLGLASAFGATASGTGGKMSLKAAP